MRYIVLITFIPIIAFLFSCSQKSVEQDKASIETAKEPLFIDYTIEQTFRLSLYNDTLRIIACIAGENFEKDRSTYELEKKVILREKHLDTIRDLAVKIDKRYIYTATFCVTESWASFLTINNELYLADPYVVAYSERHGSKYEPIKNLLLYMLQLLNVDRKDIVLELPAA